MCLYYLIKRKTAAQLPLHTYIYIYKKDITRNWNFIFHFKDINNENENDLLW